jgi:hypothetical protein
MFWTHGSSVVESVPRRDAGRDHGRGAEYELEEAVAADYACSDGGSGIDSCAGPVPSGGKIDTGSVGPKTFTVEARDRAGNAASERRYLWRGLRLRRLLRAGEQPTDAERGQGRAIGAHAVQR